ncbi:unnamed protein product [Didymodactylos carnosus]|uniref:Uncharacterized protein n=1 Tax=Didymodactylos carnosus TaxID=1234261 RepID=A0A8S2VC98_9BILA|nr:unnamed protein product [Didymodactylos carnosus]CAF4387731.1 unnamed protein product [Didymodactylos carnosus]
MTRVKQTQRLPLQYNRSLTPCISTWDTLLNLCRQFYRYIFAHIHDFIYSTLFGYLTLNERLYVAVHENDIVSVKKLLECGAVPSYQPHDIDDIVNHLSKTRLNKRYSNSTTSTNASIYSSIVECDSMLYMAVSNNNLCLIKQLTNYYDFRKRKHTEAVSLCLGKS